MVKRIITRYSDKILSRWIVLAFDVASVLVAFFVATFIRYNFEAPGSLKITDCSCFMVLMVYTAAFLYFQPYKGIVRNTGLNDVLIIAKTVFAGLIGLTALISITNRIPFLQPYTPQLLILIIHFLILTFIMMGTRLAIKLGYNEMISSTQRKQTRVIIYGAGSAGIITYSALMREKLFHYVVVAFIDDNEGKVNKTIEGVPVLSPEKAMNKEFILKKQINQLIIAIQNIDINHRNSIVEQGLELDLQVRVLPSVDSWINGELSSGQLREVHIEELLERDPITLDNQDVYKELSGKVVMVTGAAGSIGSEITRQLLRYNPARIIVVDQAETPMYELQYELSNNYAYKAHSHSVVFIIANIKDRYRMKGIFETYRPHFVYHAAAYKHVPLMEDNPYEALLVNVFGTHTIADLAIEYKANKFIMVSTDKAVNPTNVMGASKRIAEIYIQNLTCSTTQFITTRFGNVLGSNGSVIPLFKKQIEKGGPITITSKEITRYFMTIPEACSLVLEAGVMGEGGEIFLFDMGKPVKIYDLAVKMIRLTGKQPEKDIKIKEIGLRPGEKLYEELLASQENTLPTYHPKIMRSKVRDQDHEETCRHLHELAELIISGETMQLVKKMKEIVPEYISNNSIFQQLDPQKTQDVNR